MSIKEIFSLITGIAALLPKIMEIIKAVAAMFPKKEVETDEQAEERQTARAKAADARIRIALKSGFGREPSGDEIVLARQTAHNLGKIVKGKQRRVGKTV